MSFEVIHGDCLNVMGNMADECISAVITDPPYGLSKEPDIHEVLTKWLAGDDYKHSSSGFMGKSWDSFVPGPAIWRECYRVLKPGGFILVFTSTRTYDLTSIALRLAGFIIHPCVVWLSGQGFPKGTDVSKAVDNKAGAKRKVVGKNPNDRMHRSNQLSDYGLQGGVGKGNITEPATEEAKKWDGWKYGKQTLKPSAEIIIVAHKLYDGKPVDSILKHEVGAYNIEATRVNPGEKVPSGGSGRVGNFAGKAQSDAPLSDHRQQEHTAGRYPPNVVLVHHPDCKRVGNKKVRGTKPHPVHSKQESYDGWGSITKKTGEVVNKYEDDDGNELVDNWECVDGCPVKALGEQSGELKTTYIAEHHRNNRSNSGEFLAQLKHPGQQGFNDAGTASRFFPQFQEDEPPFKYCSKAAVSEREAGLKGHIPCAKCGGLDADTHKDDKGNTVKCRRNIHPTVKPISLLRWLIRLVSRDDQLILDPFCGSGSTGCAAVMEGRKFLGIELDEHMVEIANARIRHWQGSDEP